MNGCLTGLVAITAGCATVEPWAAVVIGMFAGLFYVLMSKLLIRLRFDDAVDAVPVHLVGGSWGLISTGLLSSPDLISAAYGPNPHSGWFYEWSEGSGDFTLIGVQLVAVLFLFSWTFTVMGAYFWLLNYLGWFRVDELEELAGMDISRHKGAAYDYNAPPDGSVDKLRERRESIKNLGDSSSRNGKKNVIKAEEAVVEPTSKDEITNQDEIIST